MTAPNGQPKDSPREPKIRAKIVSTDLIQECGARLRQGELVAFPTETVYGLGCHALDPKAISKVFQAKERPLTDPLIVHVTDPQQAYKLWNAEATSIEGNALQVLIENFWPGPFTLVAKAAFHVPSIVMANTGFVACRSPSHPVARALIDASQVPLAAPSANKFGHVSPTRARHVWDDLMLEDVWIIETEPKASGYESDDFSTTCQVGVESTVAKVEMIQPSAGRVTLLRQGAISVTDIEACLDRAGLASQFSVESLTKKTTDDHVATVAPGQTVRHYSPNIPSFILAQSRYMMAQEITHGDQLFLSKSVLIDFGGKLATWKDFSVAYRDLSLAGDSSEAAKSLFDTLRWAERVDGANQILFPELPDNVVDGCDALTLALKDRLTRAASGIVLDVLCSDQIA